MRTYGTASKRLRSSSLILSLLNSNLSLLILSLPTSKALASLLANLRDQFAEFLNNLSSDRLRILSSSTCVGLRYGHLCSR